ncbi:MAG: YwaF family protein, partial [Propionibacteriaceae bacterium]|nr:YwaF family protein [Propionibacteriaceae bacterium]
AEQPTAFGWYHLAWVVLVVLLLRGAWQLRALPRRRQDQVLVAIAVTQLLFEIGKQLLYLTSELEDDYWWFVFPLQPCSVGMFAMLVTGLLRPGKVKSAFEAFMVFYALYFGMSAIVYPTAIFSTYYAYVLFQSPFHHALLVTAAGYLLMCHRVAPTWRRFAQGTAVFAACCVSAVIINIATHPYFATHETDGILNAFYMGPYELWDIPLVGWIVAGKGWAAYLMFYLPSMVLLAFAAWAVAALAWKAMRVETAALIAPTETEPTGEYTTSIGT